MRPLLREPRPQVHYKNAKTHAFCVIPKASSRIPNCKISFLSQDLFSLTFKNIFLALLWERGKAIAPIAPLPPSWIYHCARPHFELGPWTARGVVGRGRAEGRRPPLFSTGRTRPHSPPLFGLKFVQKLVDCCCNWLLTETQRKIIFV